MDPVTDDVFNLSVSFVSVSASSSSTIGEVPLSVSPRLRPRMRGVLPLLRQQLAGTGARTPMTNSFTPLSLNQAVLCDPPPVGDRGQFQIDNEPTDTNPTSITVTFTNCFSDSETINGTMSLTNITPPTTGAPEQTGHVSHNLTFTKDGQPTFTSSGEFDIDHKAAGSVVTDTLTGGPITLTLGSENATLSGFTFTSSFDSTSQVETDSVAGTIATNLMGGQVTLATPTPFQTTASQNVQTNHFPNTGQLIITGASNSAVRFTVLGDETAPGDQVTLEVDPEGDGTFQAAVGFTWMGL